MEKKLNISIKTNYDGNLAKTVSKTNTLSTWALERVHRSPPIGPFLTSSFTCLLVCRNLTWSSIVRSRPTRPAWNTNSIVDPIFIFKRQQFGVVCQATHIGTGDRPWSRLSHSATTTAEKYTDQKKTLSALLLRPIVNLVSIVTTTFFTQSEYKMGMVIADYNSIEPPREHTKIW